LKNVEYAAVLPARRAPVQRAQLLSCAKESTIELRCLMNARAADQVFNLRQLIDFLQKQHPEALPRQRSEVAVSNVANAQTAEAKVVRQAAASGAQCWAMLHCMVAFA
jgi:hypothetical protein